MSKITIVGHDYVVFIMKQSLIRVCTRLGHPMAKAQMNEHTLLNNVIFDFPFLNSSICALFFLKTSINIICCVQTHNKIIGGSLATRIINI